jgi:prepilin-type N-terminal cleavage/methylation domain-containing protein
MAQALPGAGRARRAEKPGHASGFTLLEIAVVLLLMGLIMTLALPYFGGVAQARLKSQARALAALADYMAVRAQTEKLVLRLTFDLDRDGYFTSCLDPYARAPVFRPCSGPGSSGKRLPPDLRIRDVSVAGVGTARRGAISTLFYPEGYTDATVVHLANQSGSTLTLCLSPFATGASIFGADLPAARALALAQ